MDPTQDSAAPQQEMRLIDVSITDENIALNVLVSFLNVAQKRGTFSIAESAKIYECIQKFIQQNAAPEVPSVEVTEEPVTEVPSEEPVAEVSDEVPPPSAM
jgi:hypothetical protein